MKITVLGAGAWGTALAISASARHDTVLWARDAAQAQSLYTQRRNQRYLPDAPLPAALRITADRELALQHANADADADADAGAGAGAGANADTEASANKQGGLTIIATPMAGLRAQLGALPDARAVLWLCKGFEFGTGLLGHEVAQSVRAGAASGVLSGPSFAAEVARGQPTALVVASSDADLAAATVEAFHSDALRVYTSTDMVGVEVGGAVKNVLAIAVGILDGMAAAGGASAPGLNARAALITRGLAEMTRLGVALGARAETFMGLSGLGDLVLTATGDLSRNRRVGLMLAAGRRLPDVLTELGHVAEGVYSAATVLARARSMGIEMPITQAMSGVLDGSIAPAAALQSLMGREARAES